MVLTSQRRRHPRWRRMFFILVILLGLARRCELTSTRKLSDSGSPPSSPSLSDSSTGARRSQDPGSPSDLAWQAWLLLDPQTGAHSSLDSASFPRRITPKSVFIAPALPSCPDGYLPDTMDRCVKNVNINQEAHIDFIVQRLNAMYANHGAASAGVLGLAGAIGDKKQSTGPLQLNIPLLSNLNSQTSKLDHEETRDSMEIPVVVPPQGGIHSSDKKKEEAVVATHDAKNETSTGEVETTFFPGNTNASVADKNDRGDSQNLDAVVPVAEFVDDANETNFFSELVDYKIPLDLKALLNSSGEKKIDGSDDQGVPGNGTQPSNTTSIPPMLVLLLSPTRLANTKVPYEDDQPLDRDTDNRTNVHVANSTTNVTDKEIISESVSESVSPSKLSDVPVVVVDKAETNDTENENTPDDRNPGAIDSQEIESFYDDEIEEEDYVDSTDLPYEESSETEGGEILKHGEAGMAIPVKDIKRIHQQSQQLDETRENVTSKLDLLDEAPVRSNDSTVPGKEEKDDAGSNVSSEVTINGDIIFETTLLDVNPGKSRNGTKAPVANHTEKIDESEEDLKEFFEAEKESNSEPEVVFSPQHVRGTVSTGMHGRKRAEQAKIEPRLPEDSRNDELEAASSSSESLLYDPRSRDRYPEEDFVTGVRAIEEKFSDDRKRVPSEESKDTDSLGAFKPSVPVSSKSGTSNFQPTQDYDIFTNYARQPGKFHAEEANSIHNQDYKERVQYPHDDGAHSSTKSSVLTHRKPFYQDPWRQTSQQRIMDRQINQRQKQRPVLMFWERVPLMRDPSYLPNQSASRKTADSQRHTNNRFPKVSPS